jgi:hypothetical protein
VSFQLRDTDFWQHLLVGKAIWTLRSVPTTNLWSWPTYGAPDVNASWGFRALIWPVWKFGGIWGLYAWRWVTTLGAFALLWAGARRMGARGLAPILIAVISALTWRLRTTVRPETLVAVLFALQIWILETRRSGGPDRTFWLVPLAWAWANVHVSYHLGFAMLGIHLVNDLIAARRSRGAAAPWRAFNRLALATAAALAISFVNPWGWRALWQPFEYFFFWRHELIFKTIIELQPLSIAFLTTPKWMGLSILLVLWPPLLLWRIRNRGWDTVELLVCGLYTAVGISAVRFTGYYVLAATPYVARDLNEWLLGRRLPAWSSNAFARGGFVAMLSILVCLPGWTRTNLPIRVGIGEECYPQRACDFMIEHDVRGRGFNQFPLGGYMLWRFWPERDRLPFMDIHQSGTREEWRRYAGVFTRPTGWAEMDAHYHFDYALLEASLLEFTGDRSLDMLDADTSFALVFRDDAAALYVKRSSRFAPLIEEYGYRFVPGGNGRLKLLGRVCQQDSAAREITTSELRRQIESSPWNTRARQLLGGIQAIERRRAAGN